MSLPLNVEVAGRYVIKTTASGTNTKIEVERLSDGARKQELIKEEWLAFLDGVCQVTTDQSALEMACDNLFAL